MNPVTHQGIPSASNSATPCAPSQNSPSASMAEGTLAPEIVIQKTTAKSRAMKGSPQILEVTMRSSFWSQG